MFCSECGQQNNDDARFCLKCGTPLAQAEEPAKVTSVIEEPAQQTNINSVADDNEPQVVSQKVIASPKEKSKKTKKKAAIATVLIIGIVATILIGAVIVHRCYDCGKIIFYDQWREDDENYEVAVCKDCYDAYYDRQDNNSQDTDSQDADDVSKDEAGFDDESHQSNGAENGENFKFSRSTDCETFTFYSHLNLDEFEETYYDFDKDNESSEYGNNNEWYLMNSDTTVQIRVRAYLSYYSFYEDRLYENPEDIFEVFYDDCLAYADGDDDYLSVEKCELSNNLQTVVTWHEINDKGVTIGIYTDNYFYTIEFWAVDEDILNELYDDVCNSLTFSAT